MPQRKDQKYQGEKAEGEPNSIQKYLQATGGPIKHKRTNYFAT